jgi:hypothetical protein
MNRETKLKRIKQLTWLFIIGLVLSGATAIPLRTELDLAAKLLGGTDLVHEAMSTGLTRWVLRVREAVRNTEFLYPFMAYGTDWLAFGHFAIAVAFIGPLREPIRNRWIYLFGMISCVLVIPYAMVFGGLRGIPFGWRLVDCSFGVFGFIPLWFCWRWTDELEQSNHNTAE